MQIDVEKLEAKYLGLHEELGTGDIEGESFTIIRQLNTGNIILDFGEGERYIVFSLPPPGDGPGLVLSGT